MPSVLVVGSGGREHALLLALSRSACRPKLYAAPGNPGFEGLAERLEANTPEELLAAAQDKAVDLVIIGPEAPLVAGLGDRLRAEGLSVLGPNKAAAQLEGSKAFSKQVMDAAGVPTARWARFSEAAPAIAFSAELGTGAVVKADGLAAGKGVVVAEDQAQAAAAIREILGGKHGAAGAEIVVEERLIGEELSVLALSDGKEIAVLAPAQDHKRIGEGDTGPNTGGMGAYCPAPRGTPALLEEVKASCLSPVIEELARRGAPFSGVLYAGLMLTEAGPKVLEYNVRFGDPETQAILPRMKSDAYELFLSVAEGRLSSAPLDFSEQAALTVVLAAEGYPAAPKKGDVIEGLSEVAAMEGVELVCAGVAEAPGGGLCTAGGRVLGVTGLGDTLAEAKARAYAAAEKIRWRGLQYRRDIGFRALG